MKTMKHLCLAATALLMASCADTDIPGFSAEKPESLNAIEALNAYDVLKSYVDRDKYPSFKLGGATAASDFNAKGIRYVLDKENFDELVTGNAFKYSSVVANDGSMDFSTVSAFVDNATEAGLSVYGHTLCWHSQQNITYLKSIITDPNAANYLLHASVPEAKVNPWDWELHYNLSKPLAVGTEYTIKMRTKATGDCEMAFGPAMAAHSTASLKPLRGAYSVTSRQHPHTCCVCFGKFGGELYIDDVSLTAKGSTDNLVANADFTEEDITGWTKPSWHNYTYKREKDADQSASGSFTEQDIRDTLTYALDNWVKGMMQACDGRVKGWDVVNEPMSDAVTESNGVAGGRCQDQILSDICKLLPGCSDMAWA
jgi:hypothetical protein